MIIDTTGGFAQYCWYSIHSILFTAAFKATKEYSGACVVVVSLTVPKPARQWWKPIFHYYPIPKTIQLIYFSEIFIWKWKDVIIGISHGMNIVGWLAEKYDDPAEDDVITHECY